jgi:virulence-associated protein VagC
MKKKLFRHGGSKSVDLPMSFIYNLPSDYVNIEERKDGSLLIKPVDELTALESDPLFTQFLEALHQDMLRHPEKLKNVTEVWDSEWDHLLEGVDGGEE